MKVQDFKSAILRISVVLVVAWAPKAMAHMQPYVNIVIAVEDDQGHKVSGLNIHLETLEAVGEADLRDGLATVRVTFPRDYAGPLRMRVFDRRRKAIAILDSGNSTFIRAFPYAHKIKAYSKVNPNFSDPFDEGTEFLGADGTVRKSDASVHCFRLAWNPEKDTKEEKSVSAIADEVDRKNASELEKNLNSLRQTRFIPAQGAK